MLLVAVGYRAFTHKPAAQRESVELLAYQAPVWALDERDQRRFGQLRAAIRQAEQVRGVTRQWPAELTPAADCSWSLRRRGVYVNYLGLPAAPGGLRWLVLFIEPEPSAIKDPPPQEDDEHHTLPDGTAVHVSVWTAPDSGPLPLELLPFPAAEGWVQRLAR